MRDLEVCVLHIAAHEREALDTLCHTMQVISAHGVGQVLLLLDEGMGSDQARLAAPAAEVRRLRCSGPSTVAKIRALQLELTRLARERRVYAVHMHGVQPCLLGSRALRGRPIQGQVLYSPHLALTGSPWTAPVRHLVQRRFEPLEGATLTASLADAQALSKLFNRSADVLPHPVTDLFFDVARQDTERPGVLAEGTGADALDVVSRLCVLLNGREARVPFSWLGSTSARARAQLAGAGIALLDPRHDIDRAKALSRASVFIHVSAERRVPAALAQAMAAGLPCLVSDTSVHRALIRHGETGFVCTSERDFLEKLVLLLRDRWERRQMGEAARAEAERCFRLRHFEKVILRVYGFSRSQPARAATLAAASAGSHAR
jgi:hypothetical protein